MYKIFVLWFVVCRVNHIYANHYSHAANDKIRNSYLKWV